jgi:ribosomal protein L12E/L44/L45/RPP1/RPP2
MEPGNVAEGWRTEIAGVIVAVADLIARIILSEVEAAREKQNILAKMYMKLEQDKLEKAMAPYIGAVVFLSFTGKEVNGKSIEGIVRSAGIEPEDRFLKFAASLNFENSIIAYAPAVYFLKVVRREITAENVMAVVGAMGKSTDEKIARHVLDIYSMQSAASKKSAEIGFEERMISSVREAATMLSKIMLIELDRTFEKKDIADHIGKGFIPYLAAVGTLVYAGEDIDAVGAEKFYRYIAAMVEAVGVAADKSMLEYVSSFNYGSSGFVYVSAAYYLKSIGMNVDIRQVMAVVAASGENPDEATAGFVLTIYKDYNKV